jgi:N-acetylmuramate 1-kinase
MDAESVASRRAALSAWAERLLAARGYTRSDLRWSALSGDASFRRFYRVHLARVHLAGPTPGPRALIAMDAPPATENNAQFVRLSVRFREHGVQVPEVIEADLERGFLLVEDLGDTLYADVYGTSARTLALEAALEMLIRIHVMDNSDGLVPPYTVERFRDELGLFTDWLIGGLLGITPDRAVRDLLARSWRCLIDNTRMQPQRCVHRDFHSRNLLFRDGAAAAVDFQDALWGPLSYDLVSLLRDCYVRFDEEDVVRWRLRYLALADAAGIARNYDPDLFAQQFDRTGVQRHLKAIGIFARLHLRDGKGGYLPVIPSVLEQLVDVTARDPELSALGDWLTTVVQPAAARRIEALTAQPGAPA